MPAIVTKRFRIQQAYNFLSSFSDNSVYVGIGRVSPWESPASDVSPPTPSDVIQDIEFDVWNNLIALKKIVASDASLMIRRIDWTSGTVYDEYTDSDTDLFDLDFYVITDQYKVYKCLDNNGGVVSTDKPDSESTLAFLTSDGYTWKFMYNLSAPEVELLLTPAFIPVQKIISDDGSLQWDVQQAAVEEAGTPPGGHGANAVDELGGFYVTIAKQFDQDESGTLTTSNDFRQISLIINPVLYDTNTVSNLTYGAQVFTYLVTAPTGNFTLDETVTVSGVSTKVVDWNSTTNIISLSTPESGTLPATGTITGATSGSTGTVGSLTEPTFEPYSGDILFLENRIPIVRADNQSERIYCTIAC